MNYLPGAQSYFGLNNPEAQKQFQLIGAIQQLKAQLQNKAVNHYDYLAQRTEGLGKAAS